MTTEAIKMKPRYGVVLQRVMQNPNISVQAKGCYALMKSFEWKGLGFTQASSIFLGECLGVTGRSVERYIKELEKHKVIERDTRNGYRIYKFTDGTFFSPKNDNEGDKRSDKGSDKSVGTPYIFNKPHTTHTSDRDANAESEKDTVNGIDDSEQESIDEKIHTEPLTLEEQYTYDEALNWLTSIGMNKFSLIKIRQRPERSVVLSYPIIKRMHGRGLREKGVYCAFCKPGSKPWKQVQEAVQGQLNREEKQKAYDEQKEYWRRKHKDGVKVIYDGRPVFHIDNTIVSFGDHLSGGDVLDWVQIDFAKFEESSK